MKDIRWRINTALAVGDTKGLLRLAKLYATEVAGQGSLIKRANELIAPLQEAAKALDGSLLVVFKPDTTPKQARAKGDFKGSGLTARQFIQKFGTEAEAAAAVGLNNSKEWALASRIYKRQPTKTEDETEDETEIEE